MLHMGTASVALNIWGDHLYQHRARNALPLLVRQAIARETVSYRDLASELGMPNPRNLNYVLGCVGSTLESISRAKSEDIPPIQCLVVNRQTGMPSEGVNWFLNKANRPEFDMLSPEQRRRRLKIELERVFDYPSWNEVLRELRLAKAPVTFEKYIDAAVVFGGGGESDAHRRLKHYVANHPELLNLPRRLQGATEYGLPSGDCLDVSFRTATQWTAVEVKSTLSVEADVTRGLFQCVKYAAVIRAVMQVSGEVPSARVVLALEGALPRSLLPLKHLLGVEVIDGIFAES